MVRDKRKNRKSNFLINTILICLIVVSTGLSVFIGILNYKYKVPEKTNEMVKLNEKKDKYNEILLNNEELKKEHDKIENIDESTKELKEEVFKLASTLEKKIKNKETKYKIAYLTFDDGPYYATNKFLDVLKKYKIKDLIE